MIVNAGQVFYNEIDPYAAQWLRNLIAVGVIAPGVVDERSIVDIHPEELQQYAQCHFFAGIGVWSYALRRAGWADDRPVWTGSCPCQPFSAAGAGAGFADQRHLWPHFHYLIEQHAEWCREQERPVPVVLGEQVASKDADPWIDLVQADMEALGYTFGAVPFPSAGVGAPHIRDRTYWAGVAEDGLADTHGGAGGEGRALVRRGIGGGDAQRGAGSGGIGVLVGLADTDRPGQGTSGRSGVHSPGQAGALALLGSDDLDGLGHPGGQGLAQRECECGILGGTCGACQGQAAERAGIYSAARPGPTNGYWAAADWLGCRDGKWRPVEPGTFPLAHGSAGRVGHGGADWRTAANESGFGHRGGRLKGYGNAINAEAAIAWIECVMETI